jgi:RNA polymerase sigma-70 factor (ECF subfamily)
MGPGERLQALEGARRGDAQALGALLDSFRPYVRMIVRGLHDPRLRARLDESDFIQDALLEAHRSFASFRGTTVAELAAWLRQIAVRTAGRTVRGFAGTAKRDLDCERPGGDALDGLAVSPAESPSDQAARHEEAASLAEALSRLPDDMQQVLLGRHLDGLSHAELARALGRSESAVRMLYLRALRRLRELYRP